MNQTDYVTKMKSRGEYKSAKTNIVDLINRVKLTRKKEKRNVMIATAAAYICASCYRTNNNTISLEINFVNKFFQIIFRNAVENKNRIHFYHLDFVKENLVLPQAI